MTRTHEDLAAMAGDLNTLFAVHEIDANAYATHKQVVIDSNDDVLIYPGEYNGRPVPAEQGYIDPDVIVGSVTEGVEWVRQHVGVEPHAARLSKPVQVRAAFNPPGAPLRTVLNVHTLRGELAAAIARSDSDEAAIWVIRHPLPREPGPEPVANPERALRNAFEDSLPRDTDEPYDNTGGMGELARMPRPAGERNTPTEVEPEPDQRSPRDYGDYERRERDAMERADRLRNPAHDIDQSKAQATAELAAHMSQLQAVHDRAVLFIYMLLYDKIPVYVLSDVIENTRLSAADPDFEVAFPHTHEEAKRMTKGLLR